MQGLGETLTPLQYTMAGLAPKTLVKYTLGTELGSGLTQAAAEGAGLSPEAQDFLSSTAGVAGGVMLGLHEHLNSDLVPHPNPLDRTTSVTPPSDPTPVADKAQADSR